MGIDGRTYLLIDASLLLFYLLLQPSQACSVWSGAIGLEHLYVPKSLHQQGISRRS